MTKNLPWLIFPMLNKKGENFTIETFKKKIKQEEEERITYKEMLTYHQ